MSNYPIIISKLDEFTRKYYKNQLVKGVLYTAAISLFFYLILIVSEYYGHFNTIVRTILFYSFIVTNTLIIIQWIIIPLLKINKLGKIISYEQAAQVIGTHFNSIQDKLLNVLQLNRLSSEVKRDQNISLIEASINQKILELKPIPFTNAIDISKNKKYLKFVFIPLLIFGSILLSAPSIITDATKRLVEHQQYFEKQAPFRFTVKNKDLKTIQQEDFQLEVKLEGSQVPEEIFIQIDNNEYKLNKENTINFNYVFKKVQQNTRFRLVGDGFYSKEYELLALPNPIILNFDVRLNYPAYTGKKDELIKNTGDMIIPTGTIVSWNFNTQHTQSFKMTFSDTSISLNTNKENAYTYSSRFFKNKTYTITTANQFLNSSDSIVYSINVIPDLYPGIEVEETKDSLFSKQLYFRGLIKDDYGFTKLSFHYQFKNEDSSEAKRAKSNTGEIIIPINNKNINQNEFFHYWDLSTLGIESGDEIEYYFEVWDNDGVNGSKSARSQKMLFKAPSLKELAENTEKNNQKIKESLSDGLKKSKELQKEMNDLNKKILEKKALGWEEKKKIQELLDKQKEVEKTLENIQKENKKNLNEQSEYKKLDEKIVEKQKQLEELFKDAMSDELKEKLKELQKLMENMDKTKIQEALEKMKFDNKDLEKELDRSLELFKQLEFEQKLTETKEQLEKLAQDQKELAKKSEQKNADNKNLKEEQDKLNKNFEEVKKDLQQLEKKNNELDQPNEMQNTSQQQQEIEQEMKNSSDQLLLRSEKINCLKT